MLPPKKRLLTTEPHSFTVISQSQLQFHFQKPVRAKFALWNLPGPIRECFLSLDLVIGDVTNKHADFRPLFKDAEKYRRRLNMSFVYSWRLFKVHANCYRLSTRKIIAKKEDIYFSLLNEGTEKSSSFARFVDNEFSMPLLSRKSYIFSHEPNVQQWAHEAFVLGTLIQIFFSSVMIVAHEHSPVLVAYVQRETKARSFYARNLTSFALCYYVIGLFNKVQTNHKHKRKRMWFGCEQPFLWVEHCVIFQKTAAEETKWAEDTTLASGFYYLQTSIHQSWQLGPFQ